MLKLVWQVCGGEYCQTGGLWTDGGAEVFYQGAVQVTYTVGPVGPTVQYIIQVLKGMYFILTVQVQPILPSVFSETISVFLRADTTAN